MPIQSNAPRDGVYLVNFQGPGGSDYGTAVLEQGRIHGGDTSFYYVGSFMPAEDGVIALVRVGQHKGGKNARSALGHLVDARLELTGQLNGNGFSLQASLPNGGTFRVTGILSSELDDQGAR